MPRRILRGIVGTGAVVARAASRCTAVWTVGHSVLSQGVIWTQQWLPDRTKRHASWLSLSVFAKRYAVHAVFLLLMAAIAWHSQITTGADRSSLLYTLVAGEEIVEGPLDPAAYAQTDSPGIGGARLAAIDAEQSIDIITFEDAEVGFAGALGGNAVVGPLSPVVAEPGTEPETRSARTQEIKVYTVEEGDTIASIAAEFNISTNTVLWANGLSERTVLKVGDHLTILPTTGVLHTVRSGDTVSGIAAKYDASGRDILDYNRLGDEAKLALGQKVIVPDGYIEAVTAPRILPRDTHVADRDADAGPTPDPADVVADGNLAWPTTTQHISQYFRWGHTGIDIDNRSRPPVYVAEAGTVEFTGWLGGYGNLVIVNHGGGLQTYYAHLDKFYVSKGAALAKGAAVGKMGSTGRSTGPHLHFEVRRNGHPVNPLSMY